MLSLYFYSILLWLILDYLEHLNNTVCMDLKLKQPVAVYNSQDKERWFMHVLIKYLEMI